MKRVLAWLLCLLVACFSVTAQAETAAYPTTRSFVGALDGAELPYTFDGMDAESNEIIIVPLDSEVFGKKDFFFYFKRDEEMVSVYVWNFIDFAEVHRAEMLEACNAANASWKFSTFYVDDSDNSVTLSLEAYLPKENGGDICSKLLIAAYYVMEAICPSMQPYALVDETPVDSIKSH